MKELTPEEICSLCDRQLNALAAVGNTVALREQARRDRAKDKRKTPTDLGLPEYSDASEYT